MRPRLLVVDDEARQMEALCRTLTPEGYDVTGFSAPHQALSALREQPFDVLLTDLMMPGMDGIALLRAALDVDPDMVGIMMTGHGTVASAVDAMKVGALDYILKPFNLSAIRPVLARALDVRRLRMENIRLREAVGIYELSTAIARTLDSETVLERVADAAFQQSRAHEVRVLVADPSGSELRPVATRSRGAGAHLGSTIAITDTLAAWALQKRQWLSHLISGPGAGEPPVSPGFEETPSRISIPMFVGGRLAGLLVFDASAPRRAISPGQIMALSVLASAGAAALEVSTLLEQLRTAERRYRRLAENAPDVIFRYELLPEPGFSYVNPSIAAISGYRPEDFYASLHLATALVHPDDHALLQAIAQGEHADGTPVTMRWIHRNGEDVWVEVRTVTIRNQNRQVMAVEGIARDVTERRHMEVALRRTNDDLRKFAWAASHDLQEPLRAVALHTELLKHRHAGSLDAESNEAVAVAADGARRILEMVRELRAYVEAGDVTVDADTAADSRAALVLALVDLDDAIVASRAEITLGELPPIRMHQSHLRHVFRRLIDNAVKFRAPDSTPRIGVSAVYGDGTWTFTVADTGIGVDPAYHAQIFELFQRLNRREDYDGNGMGLPICRRIVEAYGGRLWVESNGIAGARFCFAVPGVSPASRA